MNSVEIYTSPLCGFCHAAKRLLAAKGVSFEEIDVSRDPARRADMSRQGRREGKPCLRFSSKAYMWAAATISTKSTRMAGLDSLLGV